MTTPSPSVSGPVVPVAARAHTEKGAEAFVRFYLEQINIAWTKPDPAALDGLWEKGCLSCVDFAKVAGELKGKGHRYASQPASYTLVVAFNGAPAGQQVLHVVGTQHRVDIVDRTGKTLSTDPKEPLTWNVLLGWEDGRWIVLDLG